MKGSSKVIMGATMAMVIILVFVLTLILVLLAELYCSLLLRRRKLNAAKPVSGSLPENPPQQPHDQLVPSPLSSFYAQGVLDAPRSFLFPKLPSRRENKFHAQDDVVPKMKHGKLHELLRVQSPNQVSIASSEPSPSLSYIRPVFGTRQQPTQAPEIEPEQEQDQERDIEAGYGSNRENFMYISNPIYDNEGARMSRVNTPFETPDSSPSRMDRSGSGSSDEEVGDNVAESSTSPKSLPLTPMKELPVKASSVALKDARSLRTSISDSTQIGLSSSSSSGTPCTSPSW